MTDNKNFNGSYIPPATPTVWFDESHSYSEFDGDYRWVYPVMIVSMDRTKGTPHIIFQIQEYEHRLVVNIASIDDGNVSGMREIPYTEADFLNLAESIHCAVARVQARREHMVPRYSIAWQDGDEK